MSLSSMVVSLFAVGQTLTITGCAARDDYGRIQVLPLDSSVVKVSSVRIQRDQSEYLLVGTVRRQPQANDTTRSHLDVRFFAGSGAVLTEKVEYFTPSQIPMAFRGIAGSARFAARIPVPVESLARIEVRAHDVSHESNA